MSKHTPGPWEQVADSIKSRTADCVVVRLPAQTDRVGDESPEQLERWDADARLIAAAPELLEALMDFIEMFNADDDPKLIDLLNKGRAAITKAKGMTVRVSGVPQERHHCELRSQSGGHGEAVDVCFEDEDGKLWVENGEYASVVFYCPVCGYESCAKAKGEE